MTTKPSTRKAASTTARPANSAVAAVEFSHLEKVSPAEMESSSAQPSITPFAS